MLAKNLDKLTPQSKKKTKRKDNNGYNNGYNLVSNMETFTTNTSRKISSTNQKQHLPSKCIPR